MLAFEKPTITTNKRKEGKRSPKSETRQNIRERHHVRGVLDFKELGNGIVARLGYKWYNSNTM